MLLHSRLDERFLDRPGCGDELYTDAALKASLWLARINGAETLRDFDAGDENDDDVAGH